MDGRALARKVILGVGGTSLTQEETELLTAFPPAGVVLFKRNVSPEAEQIKNLLGQIRTACRRADAPPPLAAIDQEGGSVLRLPPPFGQYPDAAFYGPDGAEAVYDWGLAQGRELRELGFTMNFAPVADVNTFGPDGIMARRAFGTDPETVGRLVAAAIKGLRAAGLAACAKHFPGLGHSDLDSHLVRPVIDRTEEELTDCELKPFAEAIKVGVEAIMVGHLVYPALDQVPASLSEKIVTGLLRKKMGFRGLVIADDLEMKSISGQTSIEDAARVSLAAGVDLVLICSDLEAYARLVRA